MKVKEVYVKENGKYRLVRWACGHCGFIHATQEAAEECCKPLICSKCGKEIIRDKKSGVFNSYRINPLRCLECAEKDSFNALEIITEDEYNNEMLIDGDTYYDDLDDFLDSIDIETPEDIPEFIQVCEKVPVEKINIDNIMEALYENTDLEDPTGLYIDEKELYEFIAKWNAKQDGYYWTPGNRKLKLSDKSKQYLLDNV